jgi:hypothetical protein
MEARSILIQADMVVGHLAPNCQVVTLPMGQFKCVMGRFASGPFSFRVIGLRSEKDGTLGYCLGRLVQEQFW